MLPGAVAATLLAGVLKGLIARAGHESFAIMILAGWCVALLIAANHPRADVVGRVFVDGQILYSAPAYVWVALGMMVLAVILMPWLSARLLRRRLQPGHCLANVIPAWPVTLAFEGLVVLVLATAALAMGVMATFALVMIPAWIAWRVATGWRMVLWVSALLGLGAQVAAFALALVLDQPFGPVLVACLLALIPLRLIPARTGPGAS